VGEDIQLSASGAVHALTFTQRAGTMSQAVQKLDHSGWGSLVLPFVRSSDNIINTEFVK
jgi:hypothetical protein